MELIGLIREELLKSAELTGIWEKKLREIERGQYDAQQFLEELKQMVTEIVNAVRSDTTNRRVTAVEEPQKKPKKAAASQKVAGFQPRKQKKSAPVTPSLEGQGEAPEDSWVGLPCPKCHEGHIIKGKTAYGCSRWREGCDWRHPFS